MSRSSLPSTSRLARIRSSLTPAQWRRVAGLAFVVVALHVVGFVLLFGFAGGALGVGVGLTAYTLGLRHAFDADHIAAIDNTTRKLMADGQRPLSVGFFFSSPWHDRLRARGAVRRRGQGAQRRRRERWLHRCTKATGLIGTDGVRRVSRRRSASVNLAVLAAESSRVFRRMRRRRLRRAAPRGKRARTPAAS